MQGWEGKSRGNKLGYRIFVWILKTFGIYPAYILLLFVAFYFFLFSGKSSVCLFNFYFRKIKFSYLKSIGYIYLNYVQLGQSLIDKVMLMSGTPNKFTFNFEGEENLHEIATFNKGGLLLSAHIGNWDIAGFLLKRLHAKINIVIFDGEYKKIKDYLESVTGKSPVNIIVIRNDLSHIYAINEALEKNELVCMHADRFLEGNKTLTACLCGEPARFPAGPFLLATKFKVPVSFVFAVKERNLHYHFFATAIKDYYHLSKEIIIQEMLNDFVAEMNNKIGRYPSQWFNYYNFWEK